MKIEDKDLGFVQDERWYHLRRMRRKRMNFIRAREAEENFSNILSEEISRQKGEDREF